MKLQFKMPKWSINVFISIQFSVAFIIFLWCGWRTGRLSWPLMKFLKTKNEIKFQKKIVCLQTVYQKKKKITQNPKKYTQCPHSFVESARTAKRFFPFSLGKVPINYSVAEYSSLTKNSLPHFSTILLGSGTNITWL